MCQRCHQPLLRDTSVTSLTQSQYGLIAGTLPAPAPPSSLQPAQKLQALPPASRPAAAAWSGANPIAESYVFLPDALGGGHGRAGSPAPPRSASSVAPSSASTSRAGSPALLATEPPAAPPAQPALAAKLDALLSSRTAIDYPLCTECTGLFQAELQRELEELTRERDAYINFERGLRKRADVDSLGDDSTGLVGTSDEWDALLARKQELEDEEHALRLSLQERETELAAVKEDEERVRVEEAAVEREESE